MCQITKTVNSNNIMLYTGKHSHMPTCSLIGLIYKGNLWANPFNIIPLDEWSLLAVQE